MRRQEVLGLKWEQIRGGFIYLSETKTDEARHIPLMMIWKNCSRILGKKSVEV